MKARMFNSPLSGSYKLNRRARALISAKSAGLSNTRAWQRYCASFLGTSRHAKRRPTILCLLQQNLDDSVGDIRGSDSTPSGVDCPVLLACRPPDFSRGTGVHRCDAEPDDQVRPCRKAIGRYQPGCDDRDVRDRIVAG